MLWNHHGHSFKNNVMVLLKAELDALLLRVAQTQTGQHNF